MPVRWFGDRVRQLVENRAQIALEDIAFAVREEARQNIDENGQVDTRFLRNSVYVATPKQITPIPPSGTYTSLKGSGQVRREAVQPDRPSSGATVGVAAVYAIYPELRDSYLFKALNQVQNNPRVEGAIEAKLR